MRTFRTILAALLALLLPLTAAGEGGALLTVDCGKATEVSPLLWGIFLEDINHAVDGGLYAELIRNGSFEYGREAANGGKHGWSPEAGVTFTVEDGSGDGSALNPNNPHYARLTPAGDAPAGILGNGYLDGLAVTEGAAYTLRLFARSASGAALSAALVDTAGRVYADVSLGDTSPEWQRLEATFTASASASAGLRLAVRTTAPADIDTVSLMPAETFAGLPVRMDLGQLLADLRPAFLRFPGGCVIEGKSEESMYSWKDSIAGGYTSTINGREVTGDISARPQGLDIWSGTPTQPYYTSYGLGFYEYFCLCEALDCLAVPVLNAGMTCPVQSRKYAVYPVTSEAFRQCVQDALDLVAFCRGGADTRWGAVRAAMGHPEPFELRYIGIGNEQWQSEYYAHYLAFVEAFDRAEAEDPALYGGIRLIVANGPTSSSGEGWDYVDGYQEEDTRTALVDEHFYESPEWFLAHTDRYDSYDRSSPARVFLGEYASQSNTWRSALAEAVFMTGLERNGDVVALSCYAPLLGNATANQWTPDLIFFNRSTAYGTVNYHVQKLFMHNRVTASVSTRLEGAEGLWANAGLDADGDLVVKLVNTTGGEASVEMTLKRFDAVRYSPEATVTVLRAEGERAACSFLAPDVISLTSTAQPAAEPLSLPPLSVTVVRVEKIR